MNKKMRKLVVLSLMLLTICLYFVSGTYARYVSKISGDATVQVANWAVQFQNGNDALTTMEDLTFEVQTNANVVANRIAPSVTAVANLNVDLTGTEVAVKISATIDDAKKSEIFKGSAGDVAITTELTVPDTMELDTANSTRHNGTRHS